MSTFSKLDLGGSASAAASVAAAGAAPAPVRTLEYPDMRNPAFGAGGSTLEEQAAERQAEERAEIELSEAEFAERIRRERADAAQQAEARLRQEFEQKLKAAQAPIAEAVASFSQQRTEYFARVEAEVVQLALAIAAKILHREAQVDPMLVASLVRVAIDKLREGTAVTVRVGLGRAPRWKDYFARQTMEARVTVVEDPSLSDNDCLLETELGVANFGLDTQLKEVEQGFFDLLALKPVNR